MGRIEEIKSKIKNITKEEVKKFSKNTFLVLLGTLIIALATELFLIPANLVTGGVSGIAVSISYLGLPIEIEFFITIINWSLFFVGVIFLGFKFSLKTLCSTIAYPIFLIGIKYLLEVAPWLSIVNSVSLIGNEAMVNLLSSLFGGFFIGAGCAITFLGGGSTGGVDIITFVLCKYFTRLKSSVSIFVIDALVVISGFILNPSHDLALCLEGVLSAFIASLVIDKIFAGSSKFFVAYIITDKYKEITEKVIKDMDRTTSIIDIQGGYSLDDKKMVMISYSMREYNQLMAIICSVDRRAFVTIHRAHDINGEGFRPLNHKK